MANLNLIRKPMAEVPGGRFAVHGYGTLPVSEREWTARIAAAQIVLGILDGERNLDNDAKALEAISVVKGLFSRIALGDCYDWFSVSRQMGHPSAEFSREVSNDLARLRSYIVRGSREGMERSLDRLRATPAADCVAEFLSITRDGAHPSAEEGWAYILWSSTERDLFHIGAAGGTVDDVLKRLRSEHPEHDPFGVMAAWLVEDAVDAYYMLRDALGADMVGNGFYRTDLGLAKQKISEGLTARDLLVLSPWHGDEDEVEMEGDLAPAMAM